MKSNIVIKENLTLTNENINGKKIFIKILHK